MSQPKVKILLVEDDPVLGYVVKDFLQKQDFEVTHCTDGDVAWHQFMKNIFDVCLLDTSLAITGPKPARAADASWARCVTSSIC